ncbi:MAG: hypothetical protein SFU98_11175 [Leptospiraceae bacterium]|nr:hypothetical protein [Leptospiraceae bacterium]
MKLALFCIAFLIVFNCKTVTNYRDLKIEGKNYSVVYIDSENKREPIKKVRTLDYEESQLEKKEFEDLLKLLEVELAKVNFNSPVKIKIINFTESTEFIDWIDKPDNFFEKVFLSESRRRYNIKFLITRNLKSENDKSITFISKSYINRKIPSSFVPISMGIYLIGNQNIITYGVYTIAFFLHAKFNPYLNKPEQQIKAEESMLRKEIVNHVIKKTIEFDE